ncbi:PACE efflux transporter [Roseovarius sp. EL26]|uniref:PACE efflux transporter n=1 Tax=Roseovarius sp. EL26 TaxID=2126672 RepID=UPI0013C403C8|nr:PACE efflux transporter [Roseovarius sp. EL26]
MHLRSIRERVIQTSSFELIGIGFVSPLYAFVAGTDMSESFTLITLISITILVWSPLFNTLFDYFDALSSGRVASERPGPLRMLHATLHEVCAIALTCPILIHVGGHSLLDALKFNLGLTLTYTAYTYIFHLIYDHLRPVRAESTDFQKPLNP